MEPKYLRYLIPERVQILFSSTSSLFKLAQIKSPGFRQNNIIWENELRELTNIESNILLIIFIKLAKYLSREFLLFSILKM